MRQFVLSLMTSHLLSISPLNSLHITIACTTTLTKNRHCKHLNLLFSLSTMTRKERFDFIIKYFQGHNPNAETELEYTNPYELLVAVILSAQCTDKRVNMTTPALFRRYPDMQSLAKADKEELLSYIKSISYPNNKAKHLIGMAQKVMNDFGGVIPMTVAELVTLPGVGRKTANVITSV